MKLSGKYNSYRADYEKYSLVERWVELTKDNRGGVVNYGLEAVFSYFVGTHGVGIHIRNYILTMDEYIDYRRKLGKAVITYHRPKYLMQKYERGKL